MMILLNKLRLLAYRERFSVTGLFENEVYAAVVETLQQLQLQGYRLFCGSETNSLCETYPCPLVWINFLLKCMAVN